VNNDSITTEWQPASPEYSVLKIQEKLELTDLPSVVRTVNMSCMRTAYQDVGRVVIEPYSSLPYFILKSLKNSPTLFFLIRISSRTFQLERIYVQNTRIREKRDVLLHCGTFLVLFLKPCRREGNWIFGEYLLL